MLMMDLQVALKRVDFYLKRQEKCWESRLVEIVYFHENSFLELK